MHTTNPSAARTLRDPRWSALLARDPAADGRFVYSVRTTGVYCRPVCPARRPRPENVDFYASALDAERAGFRPCRRCRPERRSPAQERAAKVAALCRFIESAERPPDLEELARRVGWSRWHLQRTFKAIAGLSPRAYAEAQRAERLRRELARGAPVTDALYAAGYGSSGRFYAQADASLGMSAGSYRKGGAGRAIRFAVGQCSLGAILVAQSERGICAVLLGDDPEALLRDLHERFHAAELIGADAGFEELVAQVVGFVEASRLGLDLPLDIRGTAFQMRVWEVLRRIPPGTTLDYAEVAELVGAPRAVRAVAGACAANALAVAIPCHRVVRRDGGLGGYRWGVERKRALLEREQE
ncbi:bifunctional DNA-binding transcriptional regulator/O6-methylguanine-DNA methyltransferase Ada [Azorhizophilus paspali]|uniref:Bifunctional DNA-binding transcriptional regulator/O6-methylguanine-DNA methyltransferase Ada n=1 Tax=Azorhizophilus paspali TaxID=69963 RepID=A0ABV6SIM7_AZOPA